MDRLSHESSACCWFKYECVCVVLCVCQIPRWSSLHQLLWWALEDGENRRAASRLRWASFTIRYHVLVIWMQHVSFSHARIYLSPLKELTEKKIINILTIHSALQGINRKMWYFKVTGLHVVTLLKTVNYAQLQM